VTNTFTYHMQRQIFGQWGRTPNLALNLLKVDALFQCITKLLVTVSVRQVKSDILAISRISTLGDWLALHPLAWLKLHSSRQNFEGYKNMRGERSGEESSNERDMEVAAT